MGESGVYADYPLRPGQQSRGFIQPQCGRDNGPRQLRSKPLAALAFGRVTPRQHAARAAHGARFGLDWESAREPLALFYDRTFGVPWTLHAVERNRVLAARALGYALSPQVSYGIRAVPVKFSWLPAARYAVLLHVSSAGRKLWPEARWVELGGRVSVGGACCVLPWGDAAERDRSERLAAQLPGAVVPPALRLDEAAGLLAGAQLVIGVDTGLTHLAAALGVATVGIYCATDAAATGIYGCARAINLGGIGAPPAVDDVNAALQQLLG